MADEASATMKVDEGRDRSTPPSSSTLPSSAESAAGIKEGAQLAGYDHRGGASTLLNLRLVDHFGVGAAKNTQFSSSVSGEAWELRDEKKSQATLRGSNY